MNIPNIRICAAALAGALAAALAGCSSSNNAQTAPAAGDTPTTTPTVAYNFYEPKSEDDLKANTNYGFLVAKVGAMFDTDTFQKLGLKVLCRFSANGCTYYRLYKKNNVLETLQRVKSSHGLFFVEPEQNMHMYASVLEPDTYGDPGDPRVNSEQWGAHATKAIDAWRIHGFGPKRAVVANVDTGVRFSHEELSSQVLHAYTWFAPDGITPLSWEEIGPGYGYEPFDDPDPVDYKKISGAASTDGNSHGTTTCGIMSAEGNNGKGMAGMCWGSSIISYKGLSDSGSGDMWSVYGSLWHLARWKRENNYTGTIPVNLSIGERSASYFAIDMIEYGLQNGIMVVAASGNEGHRLHVFPAAYAGVMAVGASNGADARWPGSNYGRHISVVAPGLNVVAPYASRNNAYHNVTGTSMAAPHVTGLIGYMLTFSPDLKPDQIKTYIERNADYIDGATGFTEECGWGRINVLKTIQAVKNEPMASDYTSGAKIKLSTITNDGEAVPFRYPFGLGVYLYQCDETGKIANYVATAVAGESWAHWDPESGNAPPVGDVAYFPMLRPGRYIAKAHLSLYDPSISDNISELSTTDVFQVNPGEGVKEVPLAMKDIKAIYIQTYPTSDPVRGNSADTVIELLMADGYSPLPAVIAWSGDMTYYDTMNIMPMPTAPGTYWIRVYGFFVGDYYDWETGETYYVDSRGEYALHITNNNLNWRPSPAPGTYTETKGGPFEGSKTHAFGTDSQPIEFDTVYYGSLEDHNWENVSDTTGGDWYRFVVN